MKYVLIIPDGMADYGLEELGGKTPLQYASTPNLDRIAGESILGVVKTVPDGIHPGSDAAILSILGYDPRKYKTGRAPYEALSIGIDLEENDIAFRCNLVTIGNDEKMLDYSGGHISNEEAQELIDELNSHFDSKIVRFYQGVGYRNIAVFNDPDHLLDDCKCTPPHDITGEPIESYLPNNQLIRDIMLESYEVLRRNKKNLMKAVTGASPANMIWLWGQGRKIKMTSFTDRFGVNGGVISGVDLIRGLGISVGLENIKVPGATGYFDTNYDGKREYALDFLKQNDFVLIHIEAPDEAGHEGNLEEKIRAIENIDKKVIGPLFEALKNASVPFRMMVLPDHYTPIEVRTHVSEWVPFLLYDSTNKVVQNLSYDEQLKEHSVPRIEKGFEIMPYFLKHAKA